MRTFFKDGIILTPEETVHGKILVVEDGYILGIVSEITDISQNDMVIDATNCWIIPGMIDLHVHGAMGYDTMDASREAIHIMGKYFARHGVTTYLPTTMSMPKDDILHAIENVATCPPFSDGARHHGLHLEGPFLNREFRGAQEYEHIRTVDPFEYNAWFDFGSVKLITLAPEIEGVDHLIETGIKKGIEFSVGHSKASFEQANYAIDLGLRQASHTFNGMAALHHREPGVIGAILSDSRVFAQVIADGIHVHPSVVKLLIKIKGVERTILVTDAIRATGLEDGLYTLGSQDIEVKNGIPRTATGNLAGSTVTMDQALRNVMSFTGLTITEALPMCTSIPAEAMGWSGKIGSLAPGAWADIVLLDEEISVYLTMVAGKVVYQKNMGE